MAGVYFDPAVGGDGSTVTDDANATTGLGSGGHRARFVPALAQAVAVAAFGVGRANAAAASAASAAALAASAIASPGTSATSTSTLGIALGSAGLTIQTGKSLVIGMTVKIAATASPGNWMAGDITAYNSGTGALTVNVLATQNAGTFAAWTVSLAGPLNGDPLLKTGGTLSGPLVLPGNPSTALHAVPKQYVDAQALAKILYADRATLRASETGTAIIEGLGLFVWSAGSAELDDDETCFATTSGRWLLAATDPDYVHAAWATDVGALEDFQAKFLRGTFAMSLTSLAAGASSEFAAIVLQADVGDTVIVNPGNAFGTSGTDRAYLNFSAYVSAADTVTISIRNPGAGTAALSPATWSVLVIKQ